MKVQSTIKPTTPYFVARKGEVHFIDLATIVEKTIEEDTIYEYDEYISNIENDEEYIKQNVDKLLANAKQVEFTKLDKLAKEKRKKLLEETDNYFLSDRPQPSQEMVAYRQHLRDITEQPNYPYEIDWGYKPQN